MKAGGGEEPKERPVWRHVLCWGAVVSFFLMPALMFLLIAYNAVRSEGFMTQAELEDFKVLGPWQGTLALLVFGLAGLNSIDRRNGVVKKDGG